MAARSRKNAKTTKKASSKDNNRRTAGSKGRSAKGAAQETAAKQQPGGDHRIRDEIIAIIVIAVGIFLGDSAADIGCRGAGPGPFGVF